MGSPTAPAGCLRRLLLAGGLIALAIVLAYTYTFHIEPTWVKLERVQVSLSVLPPSLDNLRLVCLSDLHHEPGDDLSYLQRVVKRINELQPDLICLLGDYVFSTAESIHVLAPVLGKLRATYGVVAVLGNHDLWTNADVVQAGLEAHGIDVLINESLVLDSPTGALVIAGLDDGWSGSPSLEQALEHTPPEAPVVLLYHEPDFADDMSRTDRVNLQLSGHSHGGQVRLPLIGAPFLPDFGRRYDQGLYQIEGMWLYVTRGIGVIDPPGRFNCRPEITQLTLLRLD